MFWVFAFSSTLQTDLINLRPSEEGEAAFEELERTFATLDFNDVFQKMEITNAGIFSPSVKLRCSRTRIISNTGLELPRMKLDFSANLKTPLEDIGEAGLGELLDPGADGLPEAEQGRGHRVDIA